jgi:hypothetical protein
MNLARGAMIARPIAGCIRIGQRRGERGAETIGSSTRKTGVTMGHDSQIPREEQENQSPSNASSEITKSPSASSAVLADWWPVLGQIYRDDPTPELGTAWRVALEPYPPAVLHEAILVSIRQCPQFRPTPGRIVEIIETIQERQRWSGQNRPKYLDAPKLSEAEREQELRSPEYQKLKQQITGKSA